MNVQTLGNRPADRNFKRLPCSGPGMCLSMLCLLNHPSDSDADAGPIEDKRDSALHHRHPTSALYSLRPRVCTACRPSSPPPCWLVRSAVLCARRRRVAAACRGQVSRKHIFPPTASVGAPTVHSFITPSILRSATVRPHRPFLAPSIVPLPLESTRTMAFIIYPFTSSSSELGVPFSLSPSLPPPLSTAIVCDSALSVVVYHTYFILSDV